VRLIICNSIVKHEHAGGQYNVRREEVEEGTRILHAAGPPSRPARRTEAQLNESGSKCANVFRRCRHIITENKRVELAASALERGDCRLSVPDAEDTAAFGRLRGQLQRVGYAGRNCCRTPVVMEPA